MRRADAKVFWDERAREDAFYFVDSRLTYGAPDVERFWRDGETDLDTLLSLLGVAVGPADVVVDIGCGLGRLTRALAGRVREVHALDVSPQMLARARDLNGHLGNVRWHEGDGERLTGVPDGAATACVSHVVFQHIPDPRVTMGYVREMGRVLSPGGWAGFQVSNDPTVHGPRRPALRERVARRLGRAPRGQADPAWLGSAVDLDELASVANGAGLSVERTVGAGTQYCCLLLRRG